MKQRGFTVIELLALTTLLAVIGIVVWTQKNNIEVANRDNQRKISINAMYYSLEEVYFAKAKNYPERLSATSLPSVDPDLFKDPNGISIGSAGSDYRYKGINCENDACKGYTLRAVLENEADYVKTNRDRS